MFTIFHLLGMLLLLTLLSSLNITENLENIENNKNINLPKQNQVSILSLKVKSLEDELQKSIPMLEQKIENNNKRLNLLEKKEKELVQAINNHK